MELPLELRVVAGLFILVGELAQGKHERLGNVTAAIGTKTTVNVRHGRTRSKHRCLTGKEKAKKAGHLGRVSSIPFPALFKLRYHASAVKRRASGVFLIGHYAYNRKEESIVDKVILSKQAFCARVAGSRNGRSRIGPAPSGPPSESDHRKQVSPAQALVEGMG